MSAIAGAIDGNDLPRVSVVIPTFNHARFLAEALDSVFAQTYSPIEVIVVDDGSTDTTTEVLQPYLARIIYVKKKNGGLASARNAGLAVASGELVALMDSDDICLPQRIATQVAVFEQCPEVVLCSSDFSAFDTEHLIESSHIASYYSLVAATPGGVRALYSECMALRENGASRAQSPTMIYFGQVYEHLVWGNFIHPPTIMVRRSVAARLGGFDENIPNATDYDWLIRLSRLGPVAFLDSPLLKYRYSGEQLSSPRHRVQLSLDTIAAIEKLRHDDSALFNRHGRRFRRRMGRSYLNAADAAIKHRNKASATLYVWKSFSHGFFSLSSLKVMAKLLIPYAIYHARNA